MPVSRVYYCSILDDAHFFLNQAQGLPDVPSSRPLRDRYIRACILFSWIALEEMLDYAIQERGLSKGAPPTPLRKRLDFTLKAGGQPSVDAVSFSATRRTRNEITHPIIYGKLVVVAFRDARNAFDFCSRTIQILFSKHEVAWGLEKSPSAKTVRENVRLSAGRSR